MKLNFIYNERKCDQVHIPPVHPHTPKTLDNAAYHVRHCNALVLEQLDRLSVIIEYT